MYIIEVLIDIISCPVGIGVHFLMSSIETLRTRKVRRRFPCSLSLRPKLWNFSWLLITGHVCHKFCWVFVVCFWKNSREAGMQKATRWPCPRGRWNLGRPHSACRGAFFNLRILQSAGHAEIDERLGCLSPESGFGTAQSEAFGIPPGNRLSEFIHIPCNLFPLRTDSLVFEIHPAW